MPAKLLEGKPIAGKIKEKLKADIASLGFKPVLANVRIGDDPAGASYARSQQKAAEELGIGYQLHKLDAKIKQHELIAYVQKLNADKAVHGIIIETPVPKEINYKAVCRYICPKKDIDCIKPATASAALELLSSCCANIEGKEVVVVGHSDIVGKPLAALLLDKLATVTVCHIGTAKAGKLQEHVEKADILFVAVGKPGVIKGEWVKKGAIVIDVGINKVGEKIVGDVEFDEAAKRACCITPVPGGVGPLTVTILMRNLVEAAKAQKAL